MAPAEAQLQDVLYSSVSPQLNLATALVPASAGGFFLLVRAQQRTGALHMVEGQNQHRYFIRAGLATRPMEAHEVEAAFLALASAALRVDVEASELPLIPRIAAARMKHLESTAVEPGARPWVSVVTAPLDPGAELAMRTPSASDFPVVALHARYLRDASYLSEGSYSWDASGYLSRLEDDGKLQRVLRLYRNGWCEWGFRYLWRPDDPDGTRIPGLVLLANTHDALVYFAQTYADRGYFGRLRVWVRIDNADNSTLILEPGLREPRSPTDDAISFEIDTNVEQVLAHPLTLIHAATDRIWQGYGLPRCPYISPEGQLLKSPR